MARSTDDSTIAGIDSRGGEFRRRAGLIRLGQAGDGQVGPVTAELRQTAGDEQTGVGQRAARHGGSGGVDGLQSGGNSRLIVDILGIRRQQIEMHGIAGAGSQFQAGRGRVPGLFIEFEAAVCLGLHRIERGHALRVGLGCPCQRRQLALRLFQSLGCVLVHQGLQAADVGVRAAQAARLRRRRAQGPGDRKDRAQPPRRRTRPVPARIPVFAHLTWKSTWFSDELRHPMSRFSTLEGPKPAHRRERGPTGRVCDRHRTDGRALHGRRTVGHVVTSMATGGILSPPPQRITDRASYGVVDIGSRRHRCTHHRGSIASWCRPRPWPCICPSVRPTPFRPSTCRSPGSSASRPRPRAIGT